MSHVDLCSGIGGFALGFEWAGLSKPVLFCDIEPWSRKVLAKHWPDVPIAEDVKELANDPDRFIPRTDPRNTILSSGYPCQPFSVAGKQRGKEDPRHIYPHISEIIAHKRPAFVVLENVFGHLSLGLDEVLNDLANKDYAARAFIFPSGAIVGAPHHRNRIFIIARNVGNAEYDGSSASEVSGKHDEASKWSKEGQKETKQFKGTSKFRNCQFAPDFYVADTDSSGLQGRAQTRNHEKNWAQPNDEQFERRSGTRKPDRQRPSLWKPEPNVGRVAHGIPGRVDRLKGLGNAIVPQIAMQIGLTIKAVRDE
jgi:DNA (cytosine-5)-methyltransferase 1